MWKDEIGVRKFLQGIARGYYAGGPVVELGSRIMHDHDARPLFAKGASYLGVDALPGKGVDIQATTLELLQEATDPEPRVPFRGASVVLSINMLEHDPYWFSTLRLGVMLLRPGGVFGIVCPQDPWAAHEQETSPRPGYYRNHSLTELLNALLDADRMIRWDLCSAWTEHREATPHWPRSHIVLRRHPDCDEWNTRP